MSLEFSLKLTSLLLGLAMLFQGIENFLMGRSPEFRTIWNSENLQEELIAGLPLPKSIILKLFSHRGFLILALIQILCAVAGMVFFHWAFFAILLVCHLFTCIRFRGIFNGGSDMKTFVVLTGVLIGGKMGMIYIAIHGLLSYFKAGFSKLRDKSWRQGRALAVFLGRSLYPDIREYARLLAQNPRIGLFLAIVVIAFELLAVALPFGRQYLNAYFIVVVIFHLVVYWCFGLNRFFWIWISAWPSIYYTVSLVP